MHRQTERDEDKAGGYRAQVGAGVVTCITSVH